MIVKPYLEMLTIKEMVNREIVNGKTLYELTEKGSELQDNYDQIQGELLI